MFLFNVMYLSIFVNIILKLLFRVPRPNFYDMRIVPSDCSVEYGNPSGHGQATTSFYFAAVYCLLEYFKIELPVLKRIIYVTTFIFCFLVGFTRVYGGLHTFD